MPINPLKMMLRVSNALVKHDKDMPLTRLQVLTNVALHDGLIVRELMAKTGLSQATISRSIAFLGDKPVRGEKEGLGWVEKRVDPMDSRRVTMHLTAKGKRIVSELEALAD